MLPLRDFYEGAAFHILTYVTRNGLCQIEEYLGDLTTPDHKRTFALLERAAEFGPPQNTEKTAKVGDFWEFKAYQGHIFWCYTSGARIVMFHGFTKKSNRTPKNELRTGRNTYRALQSELRD